jgi:hypothetical protein
MSVFVANYCCGVSILKTKITVKRKFYEGAQYTIHQIMERLIIQAAEREMRAIRHETPLDVSAKESEHGRTTT